MDNNDTQNSDNENKTSSESSLPLKNPIDNSEIEGQFVFLSRFQRWGVFTIIALISSLTNISQGIFPAATENLSTELNITDGQIGLFGSGDYIGRIIGIIKHI